MARTMNGKLEESTTKSHAATGLTAKTEGTAPGPVGNPDARMRPRTMSASATGSTSQNKYKTEAKTKPNANAKTKSRAKSKATGRRRYGSGHPESRAHSSQIEPVGLTSKEPEGQKPETNEHVTTDELLLALAELEFHDLPDVLTSPRQSSFPLVCRRSKTNQTC